MTALCSVYECMLMSLLLKMKFYEYKKPGTVGFAVDDDTNILWFKDCPF